MHGNTRECALTRTHEHAQTRVHRHTWAHGHTRARAHWPESAPLRETARPRSPPPSALLPSSGPSPLPSLSPAPPLQVRCPGSERPAPPHPLTWRRCRRARAPRAHPPGGPEVRARSRMAAQALAESLALARRGPAAAGTDPSPAAGRAGMPAGPLRLEVPGKVRPRRPERTQPAPPSPLYSQKSDAGNKSQASERTVPGRPSI